MPSDSPQGFPPFSLVTASSEALLSGCEEPADAVFRGGLFSQHLPVGKNEIERLSVLLVTNTPTCATIPARIFRCESPTDFGAGPPLKQTSLVWNGSGSKWIDWNVDLTPLSGMKVGHYIRIELELPEEIGWVRHKQDEPAFPGTIREDGSESPIPHKGATFCFRVSPPQPCFWPVNVLPEAPGENRFTGVWRSDPAAGMPQWIEAGWKDPLLLDELELEFPDSPECPVNYIIEVSAQNSVEHRLEIENNQSQHPTHRFEPAISADHIRFLFHSTRGSPSVSIRRIQIRKLA